MTQVTNTAQAQEPTLMTLARDIIVAHLQSNAVPTAELPSLVRNVCVELAVLAPAATAGASALPIQVPATAAEADQAQAVDQAEAAKPKRTRKKRTAPMTAREMGQAPAVPIDQSVTPDAIYCLEDGKPFKMMKRWIRSQYNMTPEQYRAKWELPENYPMVAANYSSQKSREAKETGFGTYDRKVAA
jgi:predicted transcriptional regulator